MMFQVIARFSISRIPIHQMEKLEGFGKIAKRENSFVLLSQGEHRYIYIKDYGGVVFFGFNPKELQLNIEELRKTLAIEFSSYQDDMVVRIGDPQDDQYGEINLEQINVEVAHIICLNLAQSAALFHYQSLSDELLENTKKYTNELEANGKVSLKRKKLMKYIGSTLNIKNKISENLFIFATPMLAYENEMLNHIDARLNEELEIKYRYHSIQEQLNIIKENLDLFKDMNMHQHSSNLEWIIIWLILFEVVHVLIDQIF